MGLGTTLPNYATFQRSRTWYSQPGPPNSLYTPPELMRAGIGAVKTMNGSAGNGGNGLSPYWPWFPRVPEVPPPPGMRWVRDKLGGWVLVSTNGGANSNGRPMPLPLTLTPLGPVISSPSIPAVTPSGQALQTTSVSGTTQVTLPDGTVITVATPGKNATLEQIKVWLEADSLIAGWPNKWLVLGGIGAYFAFRRKGG
ncbi:MAG: hypothetical protein ACREIB_05460, partial [Pseudomonadota bacterium]